MADITVRGSFEVQKKTKQTSLALAEKHTTEPLSVECLGMTFANEEARREYFTDKLREKLEDPAFAISKAFRWATTTRFWRCRTRLTTRLPESLSRRDDRALRTSRTMPNDAYHSEPFAADVIGGKNDTIYMAHSYHTKVPHGAISAYILHYTKPGDMVLDGFCGSGMTGIACTLCGDCRAEEQSGYRESEMPGVEWGKRIAILNDLSPAATFIAHNYNVPVDADEFEAEADSCWTRSRRNAAHLYRTAHHEGKAVDLPAWPVKDGVINYTVWSEVMLCPQCGHEIVFFDHAVDTGADPMAVRSRVSVP